jgi:hypothetical protein
MPSSLNLEKGLRERLLADPPGTPALLLGPPGSVATAQLRLPAPVPSPLLPAHLVPLGVYIPEGDSSPVSAARPGTSGFAAALAAATAWPATSACDGLGTSVDTRGIASGVCDALVAVTPADLEAASAAASTENAGSTSSTCEVGAVRVRVVAAASTAGWARGALVFDRPATGPVVVGGGVRSAGGSALGKAAQALGFTNTGNGASYVPGSVVEARLMLSVAGTDGAGDGVDGGGPDDGDSDDGGDEPGSATAAVGAGPSFHWTAQAQTQGSASAQASASAALDVVVAVLAEDTLAALRERVLAALAVQICETARMASDPQHVAAAAAVVRSSPAGQPRWHFMHFAPPWCAHLVTVAYPGARGQVDDSETSIAALRAGYHERLGLPLDRPVLRSTYGSLAVRDRDNNRDDSGGGGGGGGGGSGGGAQEVSRKGWSRHLRNVHEGLPPTGVADGTLSIVHGEYEYYHYMQDSFDDDGWGCAYRSLQTIFSWFRLQQYTDKPVPGHREIQETLVKVKDKESKFIGSRQWIGAFECALCLDSWLDVPCKILNVNSGAELAEKGRELAHHFETQGTPIMVGGGVLAYTLLGIDFNPLTGDIKFLILDPHYTGNDDMRVIHKSWCKWHGVDLFRADAFYNLCCPQRPSGI